MALETLTSLGAVPKEIPVDQREQFVDRALFEMRVVANKTEYKPSIEWAIAALEFADNYVAQLSEAFEQAKRKIKELKKKGQSPSAQDQRDLRDYFAGQALTGILAAASSDPRLGPYRGTPTDVVASAYDLADRMLAARGGEEG